MRKTMQLLLGTLLFQFRLVVKLFDVESYIGSYQETCVSPLSKVTNSEPEVELSESDFVESKLDVCAPSILAGLHESDIAHFRV